MPFLAPIVHDLAMLTIKQHSMETEDVQKRLEKALGQTLGRGHRGKEVRAAPFQLNRAHISGQSWDAALGSFGLFLSRYFFVVSFRELWTRIKDDLSIMATGSTRAAMKKRVAILTFLHLLRPVFFFFK